MERSSTLCYIQREYSILKMERRVLYAKVGLGLARHKDWTLDTNICQAKMAYVSDIPSDWARFPQPGVGGTDATRPGLGAPPSWPRQSHPMGPGPGQGISLRTPAGTPASLVWGSGLLAGWPGPQATQEGGIFSPAQRFREPARGKGGIHKKTAGTPSRPAGGGRGWGAAGLSQFGTGQRGLGPARSSGGQPRVSGTQPGVFGGQQEVSWTQPGF